MKTYDPQWGVLVGMQGGEGEETGDFLVDSDINHTNTTLVAQTKGALSLFDVGVKRGGVVTTTTGLGISISPLDALALSITYGLVELHTATAVTRSLPASSTLYLYAKIQVVVDGNDSRETRLPQFVTDSSPTLDGAVLLCQFTTSGSAVTSIVDMRAALPGLEIQDDWSNATHYLKNALVTYTDGKDYRSLKASFNIAPGSDSTVWKLLGGGGSGHTIVNPAGTSLAQRTKLKFLGSGVSVADNSGSDQTEVTIITSATRIRRGTGAPSNSLGVNGDMYINLTTGTGAGDLYEKAAGVYTVVGNVRGPIGATGSAGDDGASFTEGSGVPDNSNGVDNDLYVNSASGSGKGDVYKKVAGDWGDPVFNIKGADGTPDTTLKITTFFNVKPPTTGSCLALMLTEFPWRLPAGAANCRFYVKDVATASTVFDLRKNGSSVGTVTFAASGSVGTWSVASDVDFDGVDDYFEIYNPTTQDSTLARGFICVTGELLI